MVLSDQGIEKLVRDSDLIVPFDKDRLQAVSYDVATSDVARVYQRLNNPLVLKKDSLLVQSPLEQETIEVDISKGYHIKPGEYVLIKTKERFSMPDNLTARIRPRTTFSRVGLLLFDQHLNPSFHGHLYLGLYNVTPNVIVIYPDVAVGQIVFETVEGEISADRLYRNKPNAKYQDENGFIVPKLDKKINDLMNKVLEE